jgi:hypothetical protein
LQTEKEFVIAGTALAVATTVTTSITVAALVAKVVIRTRANLKSHGIAPFLQDELQDILINIKRFQEAVQENREFLGDSKYLEDRFDAVATALSVLKYRLDDVDSRLSSKPGRLRDAVIDALGGHAESQEVVRLTRQIDFASSMIDDLVRDVTDELNLREAMNLNVGDPDLTTPIDLPSLALSDAEDTADDEVLDGLGDPIPGNATETNAPSSIQVATAALARRAVEEAEEEDAAQKIAGEVTAMHDTEVLGVFKEVEELIEGLNITRESLSAEVEQCLEVIGNLDASIGKKTDEIARKYHRSAVRAVELLGLYDRWAHMLDGKDFQRYIEAVYVVAHRCNRRLSSVNSDYKDDIDLKITEDDIKSMSATEYLCKTKREEFGNNVPSKCGVCRVGWSSCEPNETRAWHMLWTRKVCCRRETCTAEDDGSIAPAPGCNTECGASFYKSGRSKYEFNPQKFSLLEPCESEATEANFIQNLKTYPSFFDLLAESALQVDSGLDAEAQQAVDLKWQEYKLKLEREGKGAVNSAMFLKEVVDGMKMMALSAQSADGTVMTAGNTPIVATISAVTSVIGVGIELKNSLSVARTRAAATRMVSLRRSLERIGGNIAFEMGVYRATLAREKLQLETKKTFKWWPR